MQDLDHLGIDTFEIDENGLITSNEGMLWIIRKDEIPKSFAQAVGVPDTARFGIYRKGDSFSVCYSVCVVETWHETHGVKGSIPEQKIFLLMEKGIKHPLSFVVSGIRYRGFLDGWLAFLGFYTLHGFLVALSYLAKKEQAYEQHRLHRNDDCAVFGRAPFPQTPISF